MSIVRLKPGDDTADFIHEFNDANFDIMAALEMNDSGVYGLVFFRRVDITKKLNLWQRIVRWLYEKFVP